MIDRELYLPQSWIDDPDRCVEAGIGEDVEFATKPRLARRMLERLIAAQGRQTVGWFTADEAYGDNPELRVWLETEDINYVMAVSCDARFTTRPAGSAPINSLRRAETRMAAALGRAGQQGRALV